MVLRRFEIVLFNIVDVFFRLEWFWIVVLWLYFKFLFIMFFVNDIFEDDNWVRLFVRSVLDVSNGLSGRINLLICLYGFFFFLIRKFKFEEDNIIIKCFFKL